MALIVVGGLLVVSLSPLVLVGLHGGSADWARVAEIYQALAVLVAALALVGVMVQLNLQRQETRASRLETHKNLHQQLRLLAMEDPLYMACWGTFEMGQATTFDQKRQFQYLNLLFLSWLTSQRVGLPTWDLHVVLPGLFAGESGRNYWRLCRDIWSSTYTAPPEKALFDLIDAEYQKAVLAGEPRTTDELLEAMRHTQGEAPLRPR
ncbi:DUF6082 family protein [Actinoallomurus iriomotensis]|uniref:DUF6082 family protein n=1 Tax=Actinoallomurus iriomotensis TaxID=478107 RepID=UPI002552D98A|nr:DUF6082 family protein [Actinoallomurus iriomotensis]